VFSVQRLSARLPDFIAEARTLMYKYFAPEPDLMLLK